MKPTKELAMAAGSGDLAQVEAILQQDPTLAKDWQPLMDACFWGRADVVRTLLRHGADPDILSKNSHRHRPLHRTIEHKSSIPKHDGHLEVVPALLEAGADVNARATYLQVTPLALAAIGGERRFIPLLLERVPRRDLFHAAVLGELDTVTRWLNEEPALVGAVDQNGWNALEYCTASRLGEGDPATAEALQTVGQLLAGRGVDPRPALSYACFNNRPDIARLALEAGAEPQDGDRIVHTAESEHYECLALLLQFGADLNGTLGTEHHGGHGPVGSLVGMRRSVGVKWLLDHGADVNLKAGPRAETPLHAAVRGGCGPDTVKLLLDHGADCEARDATGATPLELALAANKPKLIDVLRRLGSAG